jgi:CheY-like chemotaxis protein
MTGLVDEVFYVDDSPDDRLFADLCYRKGDFPFGLRMFNTGFAAILDMERRAARSEMLPRLLIADYYMPVMDGPELLRLIRANAALSGITLAICSGADDPFNGRGADDAGAVIVLAKPLDLDLCREILAGTFA